MERSILKTKEKKTRRQIMARIHHSRLHTRLNRTGVCEVESYIHYHKIICECADYIEPLNWKTLRQVFSLFLTNDCRAVIVYARGLVFVLPVCLYFHEGTITEVPGGNLLKFGRNFHLDSEVNILDGDRSARSVATIRRCIISIILTDFTD